ncbi:hypothetical protein ACLB2K_070157 [Fragaria x ananassa]
MEALIASYGETSSDSDTESPAPEKKTSQESTPVLPPPPLSLLDSPNSLVYIPAAPRKEMAVFMRRLSSVVPGLHAVDVDVPLEVLCKDEHRFEQVALGREFHISLGRTVPIRVHQIDSLVAMLKQKLQTQRRYWIDFSKWEVFVNDDHTRTFVSVEVITAGLAEITKQIQAVNEVYKLHNLPEFYKVSVLNTF